MYRFIFLGFIALSWSAAQDRPVTAQQSRSRVLEARRKGYPKLSEIVDLAASVPPEFSANALLTVAASPTLHDLVWKRELVDEAYERASRASLPAPKKLMGGAVAIGNRPAFDRLSLQTAAIAEMLTMSPQRAREMFSEMQKPGVRRLECADAYVDDVAAYYRTAGSIVQAAFSPEERKHEEEITFVATLLNAIASPVQIGPAAQLIASLSLSPQQLRFLLAAFSESLVRLQGDDRSFAGSLNITDQEMQTLLEAAKIRGQDGPLLASYRQYLLQNFNGPRCAESVEQPWLQQLTSNVIDNLNRRVAGTDVPAIAPGDIKPASIGGRASIETTFGDEQGKHFQNSFNTLMFGADSRSLTEAQKNTMEWKRQYAEFVGEIDGIKPLPGEAEIHFFERKGGALAGALAVVPAGPERDGVLSRYVAFLRQSNVQAESPVDWHAQVESLASLTRSLNLAEYEKMLEVFEQSGHPVLNLYVKLVRLH